MISSSFGQVLHSSSVQRINLAKISKPAQVLTILFFAFICVMSATSSTSAATFTVTKTADTSDGNCDADCSLREAITVASAGDSDNTIIFDSVVFSSPQVISLTGGSLTFNSIQNITVEGTGTDLLTINGGNASSVSIGSQANVTLKNLKITGNVGGITGRLGNSGNLTISNVVVTNSVNAIGIPAVMNTGTMVIRDSSIIGNPLTAVFNERGTLTVSGSSFTDNGGAGIYNNGGVIEISGSTFSGNQSKGIFNIEGTAEIRDSVISNNLASNFNDDGGGIYNWTGGTAAAEMSITNSVISGNRATGSNGDGGGIANFGSSLNISNSAIINNQTNQGSGGGIYSTNPFTITNSTVANNFAGINGGGIYSASDTNLSNLTIVNNFSNNQGGGVFSLNGTSNVHNSIIADNTSNSSTNPVPDFSGVLTSLGFNLIENIHGATIVGEITGNIIGIDPQLIPLRNNGGLTPTIALQPMSPAIDSGDPNSFPDTDQRGISRPQDGDLNGTARPDIGAYERQITVFTVTKNADTNDGVCDTDCSLREAVAAATAPDNAVLFNPEVFNENSRISLILGQIHIINAESTLLIDGKEINSLTVSGNFNSRVFFNDDHSNAAIKNLTVADGVAVKNDLRGGAGILNNGTLAIDKVIVTNNTASPDGGGITNNGIADLMISNSTIKNNTSLYRGGGITNWGAMHITSSTISNNQATDNGGGISTSGQCALINSTVSGNSSNTNGGGIYHAHLFSSMNLINTTIAKNTAQNSGGGVFRGAFVEAKNTIIADNESFGSNSAPDFDGTLFSHGYNLIENINRTTFTGDTTGNITGVDPLLLPLRNNSGATETHSLHPRSPAIDKGNSFSISTDQRGLTRPFDNPNISNAPDGDASDIGAFERQENDPNFNTSFDFDGDSKTDVSIFRPGAGEWWYLRSSDGGNRAFQFGISSDKITPADFTGDGKTDIAFWRETTGEWFILRSEDASFYSFPFGASGDIPAPADFDGDGTDDVAIFRPSTATWYIIRSSDGGTTITTFGANGDQPVAADYDGDGFADIAIFRPSDGSWWLNRSSAGVMVTNFGTSSDKTVQADYTGDGKTDVAFFRPVTGEWFILRSEDFSFYSFPFGATGDTPAPGDYDGDGRADPAVFRNSTATWYLLQSTSGFTALSFGSSGDTPIPSAYNR